MKSSPEPKRKGLVKRSKIAILHYHCILLIKVSQYDFCRGAFRLANGASKSFTIDGFFYIRKPADALPNYFRFFFSFKNCVMRFRTFPRKSRRVEEVVELRVAND